MCGRCLSVRVMFAMCFSIFVLDLGSYIHSYLFTCVCVCVLCLRCYIYVYERGIVVEMNEAGWLYQTMALCEHKFHWKLKSVHCVCECVYGWVCLRLCLSMWIRIRMHINFGSLNIHCRIGKRIIFISSS